MKKIKEKFERSVTMLCPSCGNTELEVLEGVDESTELIKCPSCLREMIKDELLRENEESIMINVEEAAKFIKKDIAEHIGKEFKKAFRGNKNIRFK